MSDDVPNKTEDSQRGLMTSDSARLNGSNAELIEQALVGIRGGFQWHMTPQGHDYWWGVEIALEGLLNLARQENSGG